MKTQLKYTIIKDKKQYYEYCDILESFISLNKNQDEIDLLTLLIEKWDYEHNTFKDSDPVEIHKALMHENSLKAKDVVDILGLSKGTVSKDTIRKLADFLRSLKKHLTVPIS
jgi:HTH-type transcriptional regulator/antitoxin HigA